MGAFLITPCVCRSRTPLGKLQPVGLEKGCGESRWELLVRRVSVDLVCLLVLKSGSSGPHTQILVGSGEYPPGY